MVIINTSAELVSIHAVSPVSNFGAAAAASSANTPAGSSTAHTTPEARVRAATVPRRVYPMSPPQKGAVEQRKQHPGVKSESAQGRKDGARELPEIDGFGEETGGPELEREVTALRVRLRRKHDYAHGALAVAKVVA